MSFEFINDSWDKSSQRYDADRFMKHVSTSGRPHKVMLECSGTPEEVMSSLSCFYFPSKVVTIFIAV